MEGLSFDNIMEEQGIDTLFSEPEDVTSEETTPKEEGKPQDGEEINDKKNKTTEAVLSENLFEGDTGEQPESVGSGKDKEGEKEDTSTEEGGGTSPNNNFYSSIASALAVDGIFPNLDEETIQKANDAESLGNLIEAEVNARFDEKQQRILKALENGVEPSDLKRYENTLNFISTITEAAIAEESEKGEQLRRNLIYQDYLNKGIEPNKAQKLTERAIEAGTDVEDAKEALQSNREYFTDAYNTLLADAQKQADEEREERAKQQEKLKDSIMKDKTLMGDMEISNDLRKKVFETITKPVYRDSESGTYLTALQKYEMEHRADFLKYTGLLFTLTNGFKDFESFTKGKVRKEVRKGLRELEQSLNNTRRNSDGSLKMVTSVKDDPESFIGNFRLAL